jgi:hypothetical protein
VTAIICAIAITLTPSPAGCQRGGHAVHEPWMERGGQATQVLEPVGSVPVWLCIHRKEGPWDDDGDPYWGGLQMDRGFMLSYGADFVARYHGWADVWPPREQMVAAWRAVVGYVRGDGRRFGPRGYGPWPNTRRGCA